VGVVSKPGFEGNRRIKTVDNGVAECEANVSPVAIA
jgi:hypothetical protein